MEVNTYVLGPRRLFIEVYNAFELSMKELGHKVNRINEGFLKGGTRKWGDKEWENEVHGWPYITEGINIFMVGSASILKDERSKLPKNSVNILYNFEQTRIHNSERFDYIFSIFEHFIDNIYCPLGWSPVYESNLTVNEEDIDVLYLGKDIYNKYKDIITNNIAYDEERNDMILRSKINVIFERWPMYRFPTLRYLLIACKKKFVLSEEHPSYDRIIPGKHVFVSRNIRDDIGYWLKEKDKRWEFANSAYDSLKHSCNYTGFLNDALKRLNI